jgi:uncharacterized membrane protein (UPF0127 family)
LHPEGENRLGFPQIAHNSVGGGGETFGPEPLIPVWKNRLGQLSRQEIDLGEGRDAGREDAIAGCEVPVAAGFRSRLLGLAVLDRADADPGLLLPRCSSVHTFGMRFALDLWFLDAAGRVLACRRAVPPRRFARCRGAAAVVELPAAADAGESR